MRIQSVLVRVVALTTLGSGLVNLYSVIGPSLPERRTVLQEIFPLEFLHLSRFLTLLIGFALVISSINIYKRKTRAFQIVSVLALASVVFHLTKGLDYEEAVLSVALLIVLLLARKSFTVKSGFPDFRSGVIRLGMATLLALGYGIIGFWLLDPREFGINFTIGDSIRRTILFLSLVGDPQIVPHTPYAHWFVNSLYLMTATAIGYGAYALFRPVIYQFRTLPHERAKAAEILTQHGRSTLDYFKLWPDKSYFFSTSQDCFLAYRVGGNFAIVLGDPVGPEEKIETIIREFAEVCRENDWGLAFYQTLPDFIPIYKQLGFRKLKIGDDAIVELKHFSLEGRTMKKLRHTKNQLEKSGIHVVQYDVPIPDAVLQQAREVSDEWLQLPGRRERGFTLGRFEPMYVRSTPLFAAVDADERMLAFVNMIPAYRKGEATIDLMRHRAQAPNGVMDYLFVMVFLHFQQQGYERFSLGMAPMSGFQEKEDASPQERAVHFFFQRLNFLFSYSGLKQYKAKFADRWEPRYAVYRNVLDLPKLAIALSRVSALDNGDVDHVQP